MSSAPVRDPATDEFIAESKEIIERVSRSLQNIEGNGGGGEASQISALYRDMHTLKGSAQLFGFKPVGLVAHAMEASLDPLRKASASIPPRLIEACLKNLDLLDRMIKSLDQGSEKLCEPEEVNHLVSVLVDAATSHLNAEITLQKDLLLPEEKHLKVNPMTMNQSANQDRAANETSKTAIEAPQNSVTDRAVHSEGTVRVQVALLDRILNLVGELVLVRNQLLQTRNRREDPEFLTTSKTLDVVTSELQGEVMKTRMQPIETVVGKFQRLVRDVSRDLKKRIDLTLEGSETELDKSLLEAVKDPLTHIVRNSCDHGLEFPEERKKSGKPETGHLLIRSFHEGGQVVIEVSDDGRGLNRKRILDKAIEKGLLGADQAARLGDQEICELIFLPGFSTAEQVTSVSGRGVGMDVVKNNIERIGGSVVLSGEQGKGTTIQLRIPLTLAIVPALLVKSGQDKFAIPQIKLVELVRVTHEAGRAQIEYLQGRPMYRLRGALLPLLDLREVNGVPKPKKYDEGTFIVVVNADGEFFGLIVDEIMDTADIVVKPLSNFLNSLNVFSGATILGDGSIALILDITGLAEFGKIVGKRSRNEQTEVFSRLEKSQVALEIQEFLLLKVGSASNHAIPLCLVQRLEEFDGSVIEYSGEQRVTRYRGALLPLLDLKTILKYSVSGTHHRDEPSDSERIAVVVVQRSGKNYGIMVDEILDVVTIDGAIDDSIRDRDGILGNIVYQENVIVVVDALGVIEKSEGAFHQRLDSDLKVEKVGNLEEIKSRNRDLKLKKVRVLYAEDVAFFRRHVSKVLSAAGIDVTTVEDGQKAIEELDAVSAEQYNLILSDIEMPRMNGLELAREIRKRRKLDSVPIIALTTRFRDKDITEGRAAGFDIYLEKLNPDKLLEAIQAVMSSKSPAQEVAVR